MKVVVKDSLKVFGKFTLVHLDGREEEIDGMRSFCRCGLSSAMPFCDNTHRKKLTDQKLLKPPKEENRKMREKIVLYTQGEQVIEEPQPRPTIYYEPANPADHTDNQIIKVK